MSINSHILTLTLCFSIAASLVLCRMDAMLNALNRISGNLNMLVAVLEVKPDSFRYINTDPHYELVICSNRLSVVGADGVVWTEAAKGGAE